MSVIDMFISAPHSQIHTWLEIYHTRKHVARLRMRPRRAREAIMRIRIPSNYIHRHHVKIKIMATEDFMLLVQNPFHTISVLRQLSTSTYYRPDRIRTLQNTDIACAPMRLRLHRLYGLAVLP